MPRRAGFRRRLLNRWPVIFSFLLVVCCFVPRVYANEPARKVVIPFDFASDFDQGRQGRVVGEMIWKKLDRQGGFVIPESMIDVRDTLAANHIWLTADTPLDEVARIVRDDFDGHIAIWGTIERVAGQSWDVYDVKIRCVDFSTQPKPTVVYSVDARTKTVSEIPHVHVKQLLDRLYDRKPMGLAPVDPITEENWRTGPNLIAGGNFEKGAGGAPLGWDSRGGQKREPLGRLVRWEPEKGNPSNHIVRLAFDKALGDTFGVMYYSDFFPVDAGATYRFQCRWRTDGPKAKVFIKCYAAMESDYRPSEAAGHADSTSRGRAPSELQRRECYRSQQNLDGENNTWNTHTEDFTPRHTKFKPRWGRVMLYGYLGAGTVEFDDVVVKQIVPPSPGAGEKQRRHSLESGVTIEQMKENERREPR
ncbi:MAG: hypothetical protein JW719_08440 [Pirellulales bacterium]|nr:hypothetical protein [Pirellulales bacterium]